MIGQTIGKYQILDRVGRGGMGTVYRAVDEMLHRDVAVKVLNAELNDPEIGRRFRAEAVTIARLNHPGIATIYELVEHDGQWLMVMEFVRGETLESMITRLGPLSPQRATDLCTQTLEALAHAHAMGVVHRDLKPANLMITESGSVKIMDFGIARVAGSEHLTSAGFLLGTPAFMAPEQVRGEEIDGRTDLYAMGVVFFHLVTAKFPFKGETPFAMAQARLNDEPTLARAMREGLPAWIESIVARALARKPDERFQTADAFREALRRGVTGLPIDPKPMPTFTEPVTLVSPSDTAAAPSPPAAAPTINETIATPRTTAPARSRMGAIIGAAVVVALVAGYLLFGRPTPPAVDAGATPATPAAEPAPVEPPPVSTPPPPPADSETAAAAPPAGAPPPPAPGTPKPGPTTTPGRGAVADPAAAARGAAATPMPPAAARGNVPDELITFDRARYLVINGRDGSDDDVRLLIGGGQITAVSKRTNATMGTLRYADVERITYARARMPKWDAALPGPPADLNMPGGFLGIRSSRHWITLQSASSYMILALDDEVWANVARALETRTGKTIGR
jgi:serine/threonine-protein kinase